MEGNISFQYCILNVFEKILSLVSIAGFCARQAKAHGSGLPYLREETLRKQKSKKI